jgi:hypothetical protein
MVGPLVAWVGNWRALPVRQVLHTRITLSGKSFQIV